MQAAWDGALAYLTGRMPGAPIPHTEIAAKGHAIAEMLFAIESAARSTTEQSRRPRSMLRWRRSSAPGRPTSPCNAR